MSNEEPIIEKYTLLGAMDLEGEELDGDAVEVEVGSWVGAPPAKDREQDLEGKVLGSTYRVVRLLGEGAMGRVYEAQHTRIERKRVAVKVLHAELLRHEEVRVRFHQEAEASALIDHPNAVSVYDVGGTEDGRPYLVSELLAGEDLSDVLGRIGKLSVPRAVRIVRQVSRALAAAHEHGVVHRDVKPDNIFLTGDPARPRAKVLDFGISRLEKSGKQLTKLGTVIGTPSYMPPEQGRGQRVDHRADIYGLGAILYRCLTGEAPHDKGNPGDTLIDVLTQPLKPPRSFDPTIPEQLESIIVKAMAREADDRFASMKEFDDALAPFENAGGRATSTTIPDAPAPAAAGAMAGNTSRTAPTILTRDPAVTAAQYLGLAAADDEPPDAHRWTLLFLTTLGAAWLFLALFGVVTALVRIAGGGFEATLGTGAAAGIVIGVGCTVAIGVGMAAHRYRASWRDPDLAKRLASTLRSPVLAGVSCYGLLAALLRLAESSLMGRPLGLAWPVWDLLLPLLSLIAASAPVLIRPLFWGRRPWDRVAMLAVGAVIAVIVVIVTVLVRGEP